MKAKVLLRSAGIVMLVLAVCFTALGFIGENNDNKDKVAINATQVPETENTQIPDTKATEEVPETTAAPEATEVPTEATEVPAESTETPTATEGTAEAGSDSAEATEAPSVTQLPADDSEENAIKTYTLVVAKGMSAMQIASRLEENCIITNASEFTEVMVNRGVTNDINVGTYEFTSDTTYDQIINALTGKQK